MQITFLGGAGTVTGSKYYLDLGSAKMLVDCGLFQGFKNLRLRNWASLPFDPEKLDAVVLTHAHLDHSGYLPLLVRHGFRGAIYCTPATRDLCNILLPDSGYLQERDAEAANRHGYTKHKPALPLYTQRDAESALRYFRPIPFDRSQAISGEVKLRFSVAGHILGAACAQIEGAGISVGFSGDLGRPHDAVMLDPAPMRQTDYLIVESTYGNRLHDARDSEKALADIVNRTVQRGGSILIPAFAVGRAQTALYHLMRLKSANRIPDLPVFLDSPMAVNASKIFCHHMGEHRLTESECKATCNVATYIQSVPESKALGSNAMPKIIVTASGMATGGRVLHHLKHYAPDRRNTILFTGFQAGGTRGAAMTGGAGSVKIHGSYVPVLAEVENLHMLSAHADASEIIEWLKKFASPPKTTFITHGEPEASDMLRKRIEEELGWKCMVPEHAEQVRLQ
ncbi:MAG: MBL fold metallo-hydrolase RNA specificity domain-containing protein [Alphaproteobacteria bacterium]